jgi:cell division protein FtsB
MSKTPRIAATETEQAQALAALIAAVEKLQREVDDLKREVRPR